jgi:hypothetical protein
LSNLRPDVQEPAIRGTGVIAATEITMRGLQRLGPGGVTLTKHPPQRRIEVRTDIRQFNAALEPVDKEICDLLAEEIGRGLPAADSKIWHSHPVWFLDGNPIVGYSKQKAGVRLMFWSGAGFNEPGLNVVGKKFKDASVFYNHPAGINTADLRRWLKHSAAIQWDYKNIVRRKGRLERLK